MDYTDDELLSMAQSYGIKTKAPSYSDDDLLGFAASYGIKTKPRQAQPKQPTPVQTAPRRFSLGSVVRGVNDRIGQVADQFGMGDELAAARAADEQNDSFDYRGPLFGPGRDQAALDRANRGIATKLAATAAGAIGLGDTVANAPRWLINQAYKPLKPLTQNLPEQLQVTDVPYTHYRQDFENLPPIADLKRQAPEFFGQYGDTAQNVLPLPGRAGEFVGGKVGEFVNNNAMRRIADAMLSQGTIGGMQAVNSQIQKNQEPTPQDFALGAAGGALAGGLLHGAGEALGAAGKRIFSAPGAKVKAAIGGRDTLLNPGEIDNEIAGNLEGEDLAVFRELQGRQAAPVGSEPLQGSVSVSAQSVDPFEMALADVASAGDNVSLAAAVRKARAYAPDAYDKIGKYEIAERIHTAERENQLWRNFDQQSPEAYGPPAPQGPKGLKYPDYLDFDQMQGPQQKPLAFPDYLDFSTRPKPTLTNVTRPAKYPDYLDFTQAPKPTKPSWSLEDYLTLTQSPEALRYPDYLGFDDIIGGGPGDGGSVVQGESRKILPMDENGKYIKGYARATTGATIDDLPPEAQQAVMELAEAAVSRKEKQYMRDRLAEALYNAGIRKLGAVNISAPRVTRELNALGESLHQLARQEAAHGVKDGRKAGIRTQPSNIKEDIPAFLKPLDEVTEEDLLDSHRAYDAADKAYKSAKANLEKIYPEGKGLPTTTAKVDYNGRPVDVLVEREAAHMELEIAEEKQQALAEYAAALKDNPETSYDKKIAAALSKPKGRRNPAARPAQGLLGAAIIGLDSEAYASDGQEAKKTPSWATTIGALLLGSAVIKNRPGLTKLVSSTAGKLVAKTAFIYADMLDHARVLDEVLGSKVGKKLEAEMLKHLALVLQSQFGVKFASQEQKAFLFQLLKEGLVSPSEALKGAGRAAQHFGGLNQAQRDAVVKYYMYSKSLAKIARDYAAAAEIEFRTNPPQSKRIAFANEGIQKLAQALNPQGGSVPGGIDQLLAKVNGNVMDGLFTLNPEHHLLNLTDSIISGAARTGPINMLKAWVDLAADGQLAKAFRDSGLFGSYRADRNEVAKKIASGTMNAPHKELDFGSDKFNADRVFLAGLYQRFQERKDKMIAAGIPNAKEYAKRVLSGNLDATIAMDAWSHAGETTMRVLGVDPLRMNRNNLQRAPFGPLLSFVSQPFRMARLVSEYIQEGKTDRLAYMLAATMVLGGQAVIPTTVQLLGENLFPEYMYAVEKAANDISISGALGNAFPGAKGFIPNVSKKLTYDPVAPFLSGSMGVGFEMASGLGKSALEVGKDAVSGQAGKAPGDAWKLAKNVGMVSGARVGPVPANVVFKVMDAMQQASSGQMPVNYYEDDKRIAEGQTINLKKLAGGRLVPLVDKLLPGQPQMVTESQLSKSEAAHRKSAKVDKDLYFVDPAKPIAKPTKNIKKMQEKDLDRRIKNILAAKN